MANFNIIKWVVKQPKEILVGIVIFASSYLGFLKVHDSSFSAGGHILWTLLFLSISLFLGFLVSFLSRKSYLKIRSIRNERLLKKSNATNLLKQIEIEGNDIQNDPLFQSGLAGSIDIEKLSSDTKIQENFARYLIQQFIRANWLKYDIEGNIYGVSDYGYEVMHRKKLIE